MVETLERASTGERAPDIYPDIPFPEYLRIDAMNSSTLRKVAKSTLHARYELTHPLEPTSALVLGDATHALVLEEERFHQDYALGLDRARRSKADREAWATWESKHPTQTALKPEEWNSVHEMRDSVMSHPTAQELLSGQGMNEVSLIWEDPETNALCKARPDRITTYGDWSVIADLKTTIDASPEGFGRSVARFHYHCQAAWYLDGANVLHPRERRFFFIAVEKKPPWGVAVHEHDIRSLEAGRILNQRWLRKWVNCVKTSVWSGYPTGIVNQGLPVWAHREAEEEEEI